MHWGVLPVQRAPQANLDHSNCNTLWVIVFVCRYNTNQKTDPAQDKTASQISRNYYTSSRWVTNDQSACQLIHPSADDSRLLYCSTSWPSSSTVGSVAVEADAQLRARRGMAHALAALSTIARVLRESRATWQQGYAEWRIAMSVTPREAKPRLREKNTTNDWCLHQFQPLDVQNTETAKLRFNSRRLGLLGLHLFAKRNRPRFKRVYPVGCFANLTKSG